MPHYPQPPSMLHVPDVLRGREEGQTRQTRAWEARDAPLTPLALARGVVIQQPDTDVHISFIKCKTQTLIPTRILFKASLS